MTAQFEISNPAREVYTKVVKLRQKIKIPVPARSTHRREYQVAVWQAALFVVVFALIGVFAWLRIIRASKHSGTTSAAGKLAAASPYDLAILNDHPVAFWAMKGDATTGAEADLASGHTGTYKGGTPSSATLPNGDTAADFNGSSEYLTVPSSDAFSVSTTHQLSWEAWIRPDVLQWSKASDPYGSGYVDWMGKCANYSPNCEWEARMYASANSQDRYNRLSAYVFNPGAGLGSAADWQPNQNLLQAGQWLHVVGEYQTQMQPLGCKGPQIGGINIWVNGVEWNQSYHVPTGCMSQYGITPTAGSSPLNIGTMAFDTWFPGAIGKVAIYNYLLSPAQINAHFSDMTGAQPAGSCAVSCTTPVPTQ